MRDTPLVAASRKWQIAYGLTCSLFRMSVVHLHPKIELSPEDIYFDDGFFTLLKNGYPATGHLTWRSDSGALRLACNLYRGRAHGLWEQFYENGDLEHWCYYSHGKQDLYDEWYDKHQRLIQSDCWHDGKLHGRCESYELGQLSAIEEFNNGKRHGLWETYGKRKVTTFRGRYLEDKPHGWHVWRFANNKLEAEHHYGRGIKTGHWRDFYDNGALKMERTYVHNRLVGEVRCYYDTGVLALSANYNEGNLDGLWFEYYPNGTLMRSFPYRDGLLDGFERHYDRSTRLTRKVRWQGGGILSDLTYLIR